MIDLLVAAIAALRRDLPDPKSILARAHGGRFDRGQLCALFEIPSENHFIVEAQGRRIRAHACAERCARDKGVAVPRLALAAAARLAVAVD
jgi:hypothetical protein